MDFRGDQRLAHPAHGGPDAMSPRSLWKKLGPELQAECVQAITPIVKEALDAYVRIGATASSEPSGDTLPPPVQPESGAHSPGKSAPAACPAAARRATGLGARKH